MANDDRNWTLLDLPVYTLRILLSFLDATSLYNLSQTCTYLRDCIEDPALWKYIDGRKIPNTTLKLLYCTEKIHRKTSHIFLTSRPGSGRIPNYFFRKINPFTNLRLLSLEYQKLSGFGITLKQFPPCLEELSLKGTVLKMRDSVSFFQHSSTNMEELRVLILDGCAWLTCSFLISIAKYKSLEILSVVNCPRIHLHTVPYLNVAKYGLKKLKVFDCRFTGLGTELLHTFYSKQSIQKLYFQSFNCAQVDYKMSYPGNSKLQLTPESYVDLQISDFSLSMYGRVTRPIGTIEAICDSVLYEDPYPSCTCGHKEYHDDEPVSDCEISEEDIPISHVTRFICEKHLKDMKNLPETIRDFCVSSQRDPTQVFEMVNQDESSDDDDDDFSCCTIGTTSKMVILQNINDPSRRQEIVIPGNSSKFSGRQMNIFIVNPLGERENALRNSEIDNPIGHLANPLGQNWANENRQNDNIENEEVGRENENNENQNRQHSAVGQAEIGAGEIISGQNMTNENRDNENGQHARNESDQNEIEMEADENVNNANRLNELSQNQFMASMNLPGTSRGILENCINENTENSRIEVERLQSNSEDKDGDENVNKSSMLKACNSNGKDETKQDNNAKHVSQQNPSCSNKVVVIESPLLTSTVSSSSSTPSCPGVAHDKQCGERSGIEDDSKRQGRKRRNDFDKDNSGSDDESNKSSKRHVKVLLLDRKRENPISNSSPSVPDVRVQVPLSTDDNAQPSTSGCQRNTAAARTMGRPGEVKRSSKRSETDGEMFRIEYRTEATRFLRADRTSRVSFQDMPEVHRDATESSFRVFRINPPNVNAENARRLNIRPMFPREYPIDVRVRYQIPHIHKISLRYLSLRGYKKVTDNSLYYLKHLNLELLDLTYTRVTKGGIEEFLLENPNCRIIHQNYCRCKPKNPF